LKRGEIPSIGGLMSFVSAAQQGSFTRAAKELCLTQGAISRQIHELENHLGVRLFERVRQRVVLTDAGRLYLASVKRALDDLAIATRKVVALSDSSILNLVTLPTFASRWLIPRLPDFQKKNPRILLHLTTRQRPIDIALEPFDAVVFFGAPNWPGTIAHHLMDVEMVAVCSPKLKAKSIIKKPADVLKFPLLHQMARPTRWMEWLVEAGVPHNGPVQGHTYQLAMLSQAAVAGLGIALLPRYLVEQELEDKTLEIVGGHFLRAMTTYYLIVPESRASSTSLQAFTKWLIEQAQDWSSSNGHFVRPAKANGVWATAKGPQ
jgi:LysR family transcriptional regulator, glycine cleavage system transcriptional activator